MWQAVVYSLVEPALEPKVTWDVHIEPEHLYLPLGQLLAIKSVQALAVIPLCSVIMASLADGDVQESSMAVLEERNPLDHAILQQMQKTSV
jgi:hypothetical protein